MVIFTRIKRLITHLNILDNSSWREVNVYAKRKNEKYKNVLTQRAVTAVVGQ